MVVPPIPGHPEDVHSNTTKRSTNGSLVFMIPEKFGLYECMWILSMLIALVGVAGNSTVLWLLGFRIQRNPFSVYILNLAGADALFLSCSFLLSLHDIVPYFYDIVMRKALAYVTYTFYSVGLSLLAAISTERCLAVLFPLWYKCHRPKHTSAAVCTLLWALASLNSIAGFVLCVCVNIQDFCPYLFIIELVWFILFTCVLCVSSLTLMLRVQCSSQSQQPPRLYLLVLLTVLVFLLCGLPLEIGDFMGRYKIVFMPLWLPWLLACMNSSVNPLIYFFLGSQRHKRRELLRVVLQRALRVEQELGSELETSATPTEPSHHPEAKNNVPGLKSP